MVGDCRGVDFNCAPLQISANSVLHRRREKLHHRVPTSDRGHGGSHEQEQWRRLQDVMVVELGLFKDLFLHFLLIFPKIYCVSQCSTVEVASKEKNKIKDHLFVTQSYLSFILT